MEQVIINRKIYEENMKTYEENMTRPRPPGRPGAGWLAAGPAGWLTGSGLPGQLGWAPWKWPSLLGQQFLRRAEGIEQTSMFTVQRQLSDPESIFCIRFSRCFRNGGQTSILCGLRSVPVNINIYGAKLTF